MSHRPSSILPPALALAAGLLLAGCFGSSPASSSSSPGTGKATLFLESAEWGRLVDVLDGTGALVERDAVIRESMQSDGVNYDLGVNPLTQAQTLTIRQPAGSALFESLLSAAKSGRAAVSAKGLSSPGPFSRLARNGALRLQFSELIDPDTVDRSTIQVLVGDPPIRSQEVRYVIKNGEIGADGKPKGVVILDPTISEFDSAALGIPENGVGYPASLDQVKPNLILRIPTKVEPLYGQNIILMNKRGTSGLKPTSSDPIEFSPSFAPIVVRAVRTGNSADPYNGFMLDLQRPELITEQPVEIASVQQVLGSASQRMVTYAITVAGCSEIRPKVGDLIESGGDLLLVTRVDSGTNPAAYRVTGAVVAGEFPVGGLRTGTLITAYDGSEEQRQLCWLKFAPEPEILPATGLDPFASITLRFSEPIDPVTVKSLETMVLCSYKDTSDPDDPARPFNPLIESTTDYILRQPGYEYDPGNPNDTGSGRIKFGPVEVSPDSRTFTLTPAFGISDAHDEGADMRLNLALRDGTGGVLDLAGNPVDFSQFVAGAPGQASLITLAGSPTSWPTDRYFALRFNSTDENGDGLSEYTGQYNFTPGLMRGRELTRFSRVADPANPYIGQRVPFGQGIMNPLTPAGCVLHTAYGYHHLGFGLLVRSEYNLDVEGLAWSPFGGTVFDDVFDRYSVALAHSKYYPDDYIDPVTGYPKWPNSGLLRQQEFDKNILGFEEGLADETIVFDTDYRIAAVNTFHSNTGSTMLAWPGFDSTYTWRDTALSSSLKGGTNGGGVPPWPVSNGINIVYNAGQVPSIGLPLLMRYRCYPMGGYFGSNGFQVQIMVGSSALPAFRVFSSGGRPAGGSNWIFVVPDVPDSGTKPTGGYNTSNGQPIKAFGPELYWGQVDFVVRVSRLYTHWFEFGGPLASISTLTMEPPAERQPPGTQIVVQFRGNTVITTNCGAVNPLTDAVTCINDYGDNLCTVCTVGAPYEWTTNPTTMLGLPTPPSYFQLRLSFVSNIEQDFTPELDALGFAWNVP